MTPCDSDRGEWGRPCPDCGVSLPARQPRLASWHSTRNLDAVASRAATASQPDDWKFTLPGQRRKRRAA